MYLFRLNSLYRASPACPESPPEMPGISLKTQENRIRAPRTVSKSPTPVTLKLRLFFQPASK
jgi:hypothetical protein